MELYRLTILLAAVVTLTAAIPDFGKWKPSGSWKRPNFKWAAYTWEVVQNGEENTRQIVSTIDDDVMMISTMGETRWPPASETIINSDTMNTILVPDLWGPCYYLKWADSPVKENMEKWNGGTVDISETPIITLDGTSEAMPMQEAKQLLKDDPMMMMRCMWKGVIATTKLEDGTTTGDDQEMEEMISYGTKINILLPMEDHSAPEWLKPFLDKIRSKFGENNESGSNSKWKPWEKNDVNSHAKRIKNIVKDAVDKIKNRGKNKNSDSKPEPKRPNIGDVSRKVKEFLSKWKKN